MNPEEGRINGTIIYKNLRQKNTFSDDDDDLKKTIRIYYKYIKHPQNDTYH